MARIISALQNIHHAFILCTLPHIFGKNFAWYILPKTLKKKHKKLTLIKHMVNFYDIIGIYIYIHTCVCIPQLELTPILFFYDSCVPVTKPSKNHSEPSSCHHAHCQALWLIPYYPHSFYLPLQHRIASWMLFHCYKHCLIFIKLTLLFWFYFYEKKPLRCLKI